MKQAYVTLLSTLDYLDGVLVLAQSLIDVESQYPLIVLISDNIVSDNLIKTLQQINCIIQIVPQLTYHKEVLNLYPNHSVLNTASKFSVFDLQEWDKIVYLDADIIILENIDEIFDWPNGSMIKWNEVSGLSGMFVYEPKNNKYAKYYKEIIKAVPGADGDIIGGLWFHVKKSTKHVIPKNFLYEYEPESDNNFKAIHFGSRVKPWMDLLGIQTDLEGIYNIDTPVLTIYKEKLAQIQKYKI